MTRPADPAPAAGDGEDIDFDTWVPPRPDFSKPQEPGNEAWRRDDVQALVAPPPSAAREGLPPILVNLFDPENAGAAHGRWMPEDDAQDFWLADDDGCSLLVSAADGAALINHFLAASGESERCDRIVNNGEGEPTECGQTLPCEYHR